MSFAASVPQRKKVQMEARCRVCFQPAVDAAHVIPRSLGGCNDPDCVIPLCRTHHRMYDHDKRLDVLPYLSATEQAHAVRHVGMVGAIQRATNERWAPVLGEAA